MTTTKTLAKWSVEDYHRMIAAGILNDRQVELLAGDIIEMSPEGIAHFYQGITLAKYLEKSLQGRALISEGHPITLNTSEPEPDIAIVKLPISRYSNHHPYPSDIYFLVEISQATLRKDLTQKKRIYAQAEITEYWVLDLKHQQLIVFREPQGDDYQTKRELTEGVISPLAFPNVEISIQSLLQGQLF